MDGSDQTPQDHPLSGPGASFYDQTIPINTDIGNASGFVVPGNVIGEFDTSKIKEGIANYHKMRGNAQLRREV